MSFAPGGDWQSVTGAQQSTGGGAYGGQGFWQSLFFPESQYDYTQIWGYGRQWDVEARIAAGVAQAMLREGSTQVREVLSGQMESPILGTGERPIVPTDTAIPDRTWEQGLEQPLPQWVYETVPDQPGFLDVTSPGWGVAQDTDMATTWTEFAQQQLSGYLGGQFGGGGASTSYAPPMPAEVTVNTRTGQVKPCRRRRRRRLLTDADIADLSALAMIVGKGSQAMNAAVVKAVRR